MEENLLEYALRVGDTELAGILERNAAKASSGTPVTRTMSWSAFVKESGGDFLKIVRAVNKAGEFHYSDTGFENQLLLDTRAAHKLRWFFLAGYDLAAEAIRCPELGEVGLLSLWSSVTPAELEMSDSQFSALWTDELAAERKAIRFKNGHLQKTDAGLVTASKGKKLARVKKLVCTKCHTPFSSRTAKSTTCWSCRGLNDPTARLCASGSECYGADKKGIAAPAASGRQYCTPVCQDDYKARLARATSKVLKEASLVI